MFHHGWDGIFGIVAGMNHAAHHSDEGWKKVQVGGRRSWRRDKSARRQRAPGVATRSGVCAAAGWAMQARTRSATLVSKQKLFISNYRSKLNKVAQAVKNISQFVDFPDDREWPFLALES
jgi:hypothetical protein